MKKIDVFIIEDAGTQIFCIYEETAKAQAEARNKNYLTTKIKEDVFKNMVSEKAFFDTDLFLQKTNQQTEEETPKEQTTQVNNAPDSAQLLAMIEEMKTLLESLKTENQQLKSRPRLSLEDAKALHDRKQTLLSNRTIFEKAKENINGALATFEGVIEYQENETFRLVMYYLDHQNNKGRELFSITTNTVIQNTMKYVKNEVLNKVADIEFQINQIENTFI